MTMQGDEATREGIQNVDYGWRAPCLRFAWHVVYNGVHIMHVGLHDSGLTERAILWSIYMHMSVQFLPPVLQLDLVNTVHCLPQDVKLPHQDTFDCTIRPVRTTIRPSML